MEIYNWRQLIVVILLTKKLNSFGKHGNDGWLYQTDQRWNQNWIGGSFWNPPIRIDLLQIQIWPSWQQCTIQAFRIQLFHILGLWLRRWIRRWQKRKRSIQEIYSWGKNESCLKSKIFFYFSWFQAKTSN